LSRIVRKSQFSFLKKGWLMTSSIPLLPNRYCLWKMIIVYYNGDPKSGQTDFQYSNGSVVVFSYHVTFEQSNHSNSEPVFWMV
jgi:hypothetical protein